MALIEAAICASTSATTVAVDDLSLTVESGQIYGLVGSDGAGKTTTLRLLVGALKPDAGTATRLRFLARSSRVSRRAATSATCRSASPCMKT